MQRIGAMLLRRGVPLLAAMTLGMLASTGAANAASYTVTTTNDSNDGACTASLCSLRDAVVAADAAGGSSTITVPAGTNKLTIASTGANDPTNGDLDINNNASVTINGAGSGSTVIDANGIDRAFAVQSGAGLTVSGVTIENGRPDPSSSGSQDGGAIWSDGALSITSDVTLKNNSALYSGSSPYGNGGAIYSDSDGSLTVSGAAFTGNAAYNDGGAVYDNADTTITVAHTVFAGNSTVGDNGGNYGAAIYGDGSGGLSVDSSSFSNNLAAYGGGIAWQAASGVTVTNSRFSGNNGGWEDGGAIYDDASTSMTLNADQFSGNVGGYGGALYLDSGASTPAYTLNGDELDSNTATYDGGAVDWEEGTLSSSGSSFIGNNSESGAGIYADSGLALSLTNATISGNGASFGGGLYYGTDTPTSMTNDTIAHNSAGATQGGGIYDPNDYATTGSGATGVLNTIVADNTGGDCGNPGGTSQFASAVDAGYNLDSDSSCFQGDASTDKVGVDPKLADAADNGGSVLTDRLLSGSPAIDAGTNAGCPSTDARGVSRPQGAACDIGAFEAAASSLSVSNSAPASGQTGIPFTYTITATPSGPAASTGTTVTDQLPAGETLYGATPSQGSCSSSGSPAKVTCSLGTVRVGNNATVTLLVAEANAGSVTDTATATNNEGANISASATTHLVAPVAPAGATGPKARTDGHRHVTKHSAKVRGSVSNGGQPTWYFFQYGRTKKLGLSTGLVRITSSKNVSMKIRHLLGGKKYFYRLVAINDSGKSFGAKHSFRTKRHHH